MSTKNEEYEKEKQEREKKARKRAYLIFREISFVLGGLAVILPFVPFAQNMPELSIAQIMGIGIAAITSAILAVATKE